MPKTATTPGSVLISLMDEYQLNPFSLSKAISLSPSAVRLMVIGKSKITVPTALRLGKFFGQTPTFWLDLQREADIKEAAKDAKLSAILKGISKAKKPTGKPISTGKMKVSRKSTLSDKRKKATKVPGSRPASRKAKEM